MIEKSQIDKPIVCIIGLGYVGLPLAEAFSKKLRVIGLDIDRNKLSKLKRHNNNPNLTFTEKAEEINQADFIVICVGTPVTRSKEPDLSDVENAARVAGQNIKRGAVVILESTVYPGVTEDIIRPILERESGLICGKDFKVAYSPERINPGDSQHSLDKVTKVVAGMDKETTELVAELYHKVALHVFKARDIRTAEAAKVIENIQRDLNIALTNELALIFKRLGLDTKDILDAAATKWNFYRFSPGLVGGHCIPVDPYYLVFKAREMGYHPQVILAGRAINDFMPKYVAEMTIKALNSVGKVIKGSKVLIMGLTYKENVADIRETPAREIIKELKEFDIEVLGYDPLLKSIAREFGVKALSSLKDVSGIDGIILAVAHDAFKKITLDKLRKITNPEPILIDVRGFFEPAKAKKKGFYYQSL